MDCHRNGREQTMRAVVNGVQSYAAAARKFNTTPKTVAKWVECFRAEGVDGLRDRSSTAKLRKPRATPTRSCADSATPEAHRSRSWHLAATVCRVLKRRGLNKLSALEPAEL